MKALLVFGGLFLTGSGVVAQGITVTGQVLDGLQRPVPYASVGVKGSQQGTATNEVGEFSLRVATLPQRIEVLSIGYAPKLVSVGAADVPLVVVLQASAVALPEVRVRNPELEVRELIQRASAKLLRHEKQTYYGKAFYRQKTKQNGTYCEFFDAFYDVKFNDRHITGWDLGESRSAVRPGGFTFTNLSAIIRVTLPTFIKNSRRAKLLTPLGPQALTQFDFTLKEIQTSQGRELAVIHFQPKPTITKPAPSGLLYIDRQTAALHRREMTFSASSLLSLNGVADTKILSDAFQVVSDYTPVADSLTRLAGTRAQCRLVLQQGNGKVDSTHVAGNFFFYQYTPRLAGHAYADVPRKSKDLQQIMARPYNPAFWLDNAVLKNSPLDEKLIQDLEGQRVFRRM
ncbi:carboxypeptidase-like regulatory domain-containing protein [Hymenobacter tibetensis]|uniref:Carboxypeptidase-like regulatory domain-containing protein n=1 Tax=Hymenobacter tibetensis TaxID=497967 RepID=A0ABY4D1Q0_9BACT|nr:carboxypeptidase-like regulatory domain-containing protein [Hymenobacter tibetensis]UOG76310.1 carboxypeptidase-like regulatory domain-containing protein [Hymenobacter tibetensis]